jgi:RimJ/RimL family protein N-acetyltransferase
MSAKLETERLVLPSLGGRHLSQILEIWTHPDVRRHLWDDKVIGEERAGIEIARSKECFRAEGFGQWAVRRRKHLRVIGSCGILKIPDCEQVELVYCIDPALWNNGYATEAARAVVEYAFRGIELPMLFGRCAADNVASRRVLEKVGMEPGVPHPNPACQGSHLSLFREDYLASVG